MESRDKSVKPSQQENPATNTQNTSQSPTPQSELDRVHQPIPPITTEL